MTIRHTYSGRHAAPLLIAAAALAAAACTGKKGPPPKQAIPVATTVVRRAAVPITILANGAVSPMQTANVSSQVDGIITRVNFQEGQDVEKGQVLFQIDARPYEAAYNQAKANLTRDSASAAYAAIEAVRYDSLVRKDYVTKEQAGQEEATAAAAAATVQSDAALLASAKFNLDNTTVRAPITGRTGNLLVRTGNLVHGAAATPLVLINQIHPILVQFAVPATNLPDIQKYSAKGALAVTVFQVATPTATAPPGSTPSAADPGGDTPPGTAVAPAGSGQPSRSGGGRRHGGGAGNGTTPAGNGSPPAANGPPNLSAAPGTSGQGTAGQDPGANAGANASAGATDSGSAASNSTDDNSGGGPPGGGVYGAATDVVPVGPGVAGSLSFVNNAIDTTTGTVLLKATFDNPKSELWPGEYVATVLRLYIQPDAIVVPPQAVMTGQQGTYVFVVDTKTNTAQQRPVVIQRSTDTLDVISSGLAEGEHVVTDGQSRLQNGSQVNVRALTNTGGAPRPAAGKSVTAGHPRTSD
jgi:membrane fusion protein, multidrug efflux system